MKLGNMLVMGLTTLALTPSSWALVGGPWDHLIKGVYSRRNTDGLYEASVTMKNGTGFIRFTSAVNRGTLADTPPTNSSAPLNSNNGRVPTESRTNQSTLSASARRQTLHAESNTVIFYRGNAYYGSVFGSVNAQSRSVSGGGGGQSTLIEALEIDLGAINAGAGVTQIDRGLTNVRGFSESMNLNFAGKVVKDAPEVRFEAKGQAFFFSRPELKVTQVVYDPSVPPTTPVQPGAIYQLEVVDSGFPKPDAAVNIRLFGGRVALETTFNTATTAAPPAGGN